MKRLAITLTLIILMVITLLFVRNSSHKKENVQSSYVYERYSDSLLVQAMIKVAGEMGFHLISIEPYKPDSKGKYLENTLDLFQLKLHENEPIALYWKEKRLFNKIELAALLLKNPQGSLYDSLIMDDGMVLFRTDVSTKRKESWFLLNRKLEEFENRIALIARDDSFYFRGYGELVLEGKR